MEYTQQQGKLVMPEYGRNIQQMVEHALTIEDKEERTRCVQAIMRTMANLFPYLRTEDSKHKIYDHLALMSDFRLDIDFPYGTPQPEEMALHPLKPEMALTPLHDKHYGRQIEKMIQVAIAQEDNDKRQALIGLIAQRMMDNYRQWNKDEATAEHIAADIKRMSCGKLTLDDCIAILENRQTNDVANKTKRTVAAKKRKKK